MTLKGASNVKQGKSKALQTKALEKYISKVLLFRIKVNLYFFTIMNFINSNIAQFLK